MFKFPLVSWMQYFKLLFSLPFPLLIRFFYSRGTRVIWLISQMFRDHEHDFEVDLERLMDTRFRRWDFSKALLTAILYISFKYLVLFWYWTQVSMGKAISTTAPFSSEWEQTTREIACGQDRVQWAYLALLDSQFEQFTCHPKRLQYTIFLGLQSCIEDPEKNHPPLSLTSCLFYCYYYYYF